MRRGRPQVAGPARLLALSALLLAGCSRIVVLHDPLTPAEHNDLGVAYEAAGRLELAEREYRKSLRRQRRDARTWVNLGNVVGSQGRLREAERCYRSALRWKPDDGDALNNLAVTLARQGRQLDEAEALALRAIGRADSEGLAARDSIYRATLDEVRKAKRAAPGGGAGFGPRNFRAARIRSSSEPP